MDLLIKILAAFLALTQVATRPDAIKKQFGPESDRAEGRPVVGRWLRP